MNKTKIILASSSPRRIDMMRANGIDPIIMPAHVDETVPQGLNGSDAVMYLALKKALSVEEKILTSDLQNPILIAADTIVYTNRIIGKPQDKQDAQAILMELMGSCHYVITGVCILQAATERRRCFFEVTKVFFKPYTLSDIDAYLDTQEPYDKAGAYAIQGHFGKYIDHIEGDLNNVIGFPWDRIQTELKNFSL